MNHYEELPYSYRGFHEGEYLHRYYLPESLRSEISPRDMLVVYWILRGFSHGDPPRQIRPAAFREASLIQQADNRAITLLEDTLTINYTQERLSRVIQFEQVKEIVAACYSYMQALADTGLNDAETDLLIGLNERLRGLQHDVTHRIVNLNSSMREAGNNCDLKVRYSFELRDDVTDYRKLDHNSVFSFTDRCRTIDEADIEEMRHRSVKDWNNKRHIGNRLYQAPHCWIFNCLEDMSAAPLRHLLRVGRVTADVACNLTRHISLH